MVCCSAPKATLCGFKTSFYNSDKCTGWGYVTKFASSQQYLLYNIIIIMIFEISK